MKLLMKKESIKEEKEEKPTRKRRVQTAGYGADETKTVTIRINAKDEEKVNLVKEFLGITSTTDVYRYALNQAVNQLNKEY